MSYIAQSHVSFGDLWTAALHNIMMDNTAAPFSSAVQYSVMYWPTTTTIGGIALAAGQVLTGVSAAAPAGAYPPGQKLSLFASIPPMSGLVAAGFTQPESSGAAVDGLRPVEPMLTFVDSSNTAREWVDDLRGTPGTMALKVRYKMAGANTSKSVKFLAHIAASSDGDASISAKVLAASNAGTVTCPDTADVMDEVSITLTNADSIAKGDWFCLALTRDVSVANNATGNVQVMSVELQYG